jgi:hypothetical protein
MDGKDTVGVKSALCRLEDGKEKRRIRHRLNEKKNSGKFGTKECYHVKLSCFTLKRPIKSVNSEGLQA